MRRKRLTRAEPTTSLRKAQLVKVFILISEHGEYENFTRDILGVFTSEELAHAAIPALQALQQKRWEEYEARDKRREDYLAVNFTPDRVYPPSAPGNGSPFPAGCVLYKNEQYAEAESAAGPEIVTVPAWEDCKYEIETFDLDSTSYI